MSPRAKQLHELRQRVAEMMAEEFGYEHPWQVPPSYVEPRVQTYWMANVLADQLRPDVQK